MRGDALASGKNRSASFNMSGGQDEVTSDLKLMAKTEFMEKYVIGTEKYEECVHCLKMGKPLPISSNYFLTTLRRLRDIPIQQAEEIHPEKPSSGYRGNAVGDSVLVLPVEKDNTSRLLIPDSAAAKTDIGFIKSCGEKVENFKPGQLVLFDKFASHGAEIPLIDEEGVERVYLLLKSFDLMLILEKVTL